MAAKPPRALLIDCPPSRHDGGGRQRRACAWNDPVLQKARMVAVVVLVAAALITGLVFLCIFLDREFPNKDPVFTVAITGVAGLDDDVPAATPATLSPVFDLAFQIDNTRNADHDACVPGLSRADVSYGDAFLAGGSVPPFCAGKRRTTSSTARAWGQNVDVPVFLREQLAAELSAGDASVDVKVTVPKNCDSSSCGRAVLSCKAKIGGGTSPACRLDYG